MTDSAMVVAYPTSPGELSGGWTLSPRVAHGEHSSLVRNCQLSLSSGPVIDLTRL